MITAIIAITHFEKFEDFFISLEGCVLGSTFWIGSVLVLGSTVLDSFLIGGVVFSFGGIEWNSFIDYPENISIVLFTNGCNFRCEYCHNKFLFDNSKSIPLDFLFENLEKRKKFNDAVVICGGEPTIHPGLKPFLKYIKQIGYKTKLDTNGTNADALIEISEFCDYIAMDIKTSFNKYYLLFPEQINNSDFTNKILNNVKKSIEIIRKRKNSEFRTTVYPNFVDFQDLNNIRQIVEEAGVDWFLQKYVARTEAESGLTAKDKQIESLSEKIICDFLNISSLDSERISVL